MAWLSVDAVSLDGEESWDTWRHTSYCGLLVFLKVIVDEPEDEGGLVIRNLLAT